jgi:outer membrane receptor protein involved in Fe transport
MTADVTFYRMDWKDIQIQAEDPDPLLFGTGIINFPKARINGIEGNFSFLPVESLTLTATLGYNDAKMAEEARLWPDTEDEVVIPKDTRLPLMPKWKFSFSPRWDFDGTIWNAQPWVMATWTYNGDSLNSLGVQSTIGQAGIATSPAYNVVDLRFGLEGENWSAQIFADNLLNEYAQMFYSTRQTQPRLTVLPPRIIGIQYRRDFDW